MFAHLNRMLARPSSRVAAIVLGCAGGMTFANPFLDRLILPADEQEEKRNNAPFDPNQTDVMGYGKLDFVKPEVEHPEVNIGVMYLLEQSLPKWLAYFLVGQYVKEFKQEYFESKPVDILDARTRNLTFQESGFTLLKLNEPSKTSNWRSSRNVEQHFQAEIRPELMKLFPGATRIEFTYTVVRGGSRLGDQPAAIDGPHLDYSQDDRARLELHKTYPINENVKEQIALLGKSDTPEEEFQTIIGIWKPIHMKDPVYDHPLAVMDASTFQKEHERPFHLHMTPFALHNLNAGITHDAKQKWYYYPYQDETEVLVFSQYSKGRHFCNPHTSLLVPNRPPDKEEYDTRQSIEIRAVVYFPRRRGGGEPYQSTVQ